MTQIFLLTRNGQQQNNTLITISAGQSGRLAYFLPFINLYNKDKQSEKASWWINELDSLGIKKSNYNKTESNYLQNPEDLSADIK